MTSIFTQKYVFLFCKILFVESTSSTYGNENRKELALFPAKRAHANFCI